MLIIKEEKGRKDGDIFVELTRNRGLNVSDCDRISYWCDKPHLTYFIRDISSVFTYKELKGIFNDILRSREPEEPFEPKDGDILYKKVLDSEWVYIFKNVKDKQSHNRYVSYRISTNELFYDSGCIYSSDSRPATEEEKQILFDKLKRVGKRWNPEKKRIEDIPEEPKIGDWCIFWDYEYKYAFVGVLTNISSSRECSYQMDNAANYVNAVKWNGTREHLEKVRKGEI